MELDLRRGAADDHLMVADGREEVVAARGDRQLLGVADGRNRGAAPLHPLDGPLHVLLDPLAALLVALLQAFEPLVEPIGVLQRELGKARPQRVTSAGA